VTNRKNGQKMAKFYKMAKGVFSWPAQLKNGQSGKPVNHALSLRMISILICINLLLDTAL